MPSLLHNILVQIAKKRIKTTQSKKTVSPNQLSTSIQRLKVEISHAVKETLFIIIGVCSAGFGLKGFLLPNSFIDGGATGISLLLERITELPLGYLLVLINLPFILLASRTLNVRFAIKSILAIGLLAIIVHTVSYPIITDDKLLIAVFGGFFLGLGIGMAMRGGSVIDGTEVLAIFLSRKMSITIGDVLLLINIIIFSFGAYLLSIETALYAILTYLSAAKTVDFVVDGVEEYVGVTIISDHHQDIRKVLTEKLRHTCTIYPARGGFNNTSEIYDKVVIYIVVTRLELARLETEIDKIDQKAFLTMGLVKDIKGGMIKKKTIKKIKQKQRS